MSYNRQNHITKKNIGFVLPAYNEENNIIKLIRKIKNRYKNSLIIIVDDSNHKKTWNLIKKSKLNVKYIYRGKKLGRGSAVMLGLKELIKRKTITVFVEMDTDFSHAVTELPRNLNYFYKNSLDLLIASRYLKKSKIINWSLSRRIFSLLANYLARNLLDIAISDFTNGYRIYSKRSVKRIIKNCGKIGDGFIILSEILVELYINKLKIQEIESIFVNRERGESSVNLKLILLSLLGLVKLYINKRKKINLIFKSKNL